MDPQANLIPRIELIKEKKILGKRMTMSFSKNTTFELWRSFMQIRPEIKKTLSKDLFSIQVYKNNFDFRNFNPDYEFEKWAGVEVSDFDLVPEKLESFILKSGLYAVFLYRGPAREAINTFTYISSVWLPQSNFDLDDRPHFEILGEKYKNNEIDSEEEIWIPVRPR